MGPEMKCGVCSKYIEYVVGTAVKSCIFLKYKFSDTVCHLSQSFLNAAATKVDVLVDIFGNFMPLIPTLISSLSLSSPT